jgi:hypothetical protein
MRLSAESALWHFQVPLAVSLGRSQGCLILDSVPVDDLPLLLDAIYYRPIVGGTGPAKMTNGILPKMSRRLAALRLLLEAL